MALDPDNPLLKGGHARNAITSKSYGERDFLREPVVRTLPSSGRAAKAFSLVVFLSCPKEQ
jgi:hypothetical protein